MPSIRKPGTRSTHRCDPLHRRNLPPTQNPDSRLSGFYPPRFSRSADQTRRRANAYCLGGSHLKYIRRKPTCTAGNNVLYQWVIFMRLKELGTPANRQNLFSATHRFDLSGNPAMVLSKSRFPSRPTDSQRVSKNPLTSPAYTVEVDLYRPARRSTSFG